MQIDCHSCYQRSSRSAHLHIQTQPDQASAIDYRCHPDLPVLWRGHHAGCPMPKNYHCRFHGLSDSANRRLVPKPSTDEGVYLQEQSAEDVGDTSGHHERKSSLQVLCPEGRAHRSGLHAQRALWIRPGRQLLHGPRGHPERAPTHRALRKPMPTRARNVEQEQVVQHHPHPGPWTMGMGLRVQPAEPRRQRSQRRPFLHSQCCVHSQQTAGTVEARSVLHQILYGFGHVIEAS